MDKHDHYAQVQSQTSHLENWTYNGLLGLVLVLPLVMTPHISADVFDTAKLVALRLITLFATAAWGMYVITSKKLTFRWSRFDLVLLGFLALVIVSTALSIQPSLSVLGKYQRYEGLLTFINYALIYGLALQSFSSFERVRTLARLLAAVGGIVSIYGLMQFTGLDPLSWPGQRFELWRSFSTLGNPDMLGGFLVLAFPASLVAFLDAVDARKSGIYAVFLTLVVACLLTTYTRGAWLGALAGMLVVLVLLGNSILAQPKKLAIVFTALVVTTLAVTFYPHTAHETTLLERIQSTSQICEGSVGSRLEIWKAALRATEERPLFGFGPDTFRLTSQKYQTLRYTQMTRGQLAEDNAHNYLLQLSSTVGLPAALLFGIFVIGAVWRARKASLHYTLAAKRIHAGLIASITGYFVYLLFGVSVIGTTALFWLLLGAVLSRAYFMRQTAPRSKVAFAIVPIVGALVIVMAYFAVSTFAADYYFKQALNTKDDYFRMGLGYRDMGYPNQATANFETAISLYKNGLYYDWYGRYLQELGFAQKNPSVLVKSKDVVEVACGFEPAESDHWINLANAYSALSAQPGDMNFNSSIEALQNAIAASPNSTEGQLLLGRSYAMLGRYDDALEMLGFVQKIDPNSPDMHLSMAQVYGALGNKNLALKHYRAYAALNPNDRTVDQIIQRLE